MTWTMTLKCFRRQHYSVYKDKPRPRWQRLTVYIMGCCVVTAIAWWMLRDTTPVQFVHPSSEDFNAPPGESASRAHIDDVYWRVAIRHVGDTLSEVCKTHEYAVLTHKNILMDGQRMPESYIYLCDPIGGDIVSVLNPRRVVSAGAVEKVSCVETYGNVTKTIVRHYPFSLKYICGQTFTQRTRVVREPVEACTWLHAIDIVESVWD